MSGSQDLVVELVQPLGQPPRNLLTAPAAESERNYQKFNEISSSPAALIALAPTAAPGSGAVIIEVMSSIETSRPGNDSACSPNVR